MRLNALIVTILLCACSGGTPATTPHEGGVCACECPDGSSGWEFCPTSDGCHCEDMGTTADSGHEMGNEEDELATLVDSIVAPAFGSDALDDSDRCVGGLAVVVTPDRGFIRGFGTTEAGGATAPDGRSLFQIGSLTKVFTGVVLARMVIDGQVAPSDSVRVSVADDLRDALPDDFPTLGQLVSHHAGLPPFPTNMVDRDQDGMRDPTVDPLSPAEGYSRENLRDFLESWTATEVSPYAYSNAGSGLLAVAVQDRSAAESYDAMLQAMLLQDLGMSSTWGEVLAIPDEAEDRLVQGYATVNDARIPGRPGQMGVLAGAGEIVTSGDDMLRFLSAATGVEQTPLAEAFELAFTPLASGSPGRDIGFAVDIESSPDGDILRKAGNTSSYTAYMMFRPTTSTGVAVMASCGGFMTVASLAESVFTAVHGQ